MNKSNRLSSVFEDFGEDSKPKFKDKDYQFANFRDYIRTDQKSRLKRTNITKKTVPEQKELSFLKKDATVIDLKQKLAEIEPILHAKSEPTSTSNVKSKFNQLTRNPNIQNLLQDIRTKSGVNQLSEDLKNEFDMFLNASFNFSINNKKPDWNFLTLGDYEAEEHLSKKSEISKEEQSKNKIVETSIKEVPFLSREVTKLATKSAKPVKTENETKASAIKVNKNDDNMQIALIGNNNKSMIELNKMIENIKRIDLPKFQPELLQICQYGSDAQLLNFFPQDLDNDLNNKQNDLGRFCVHECCVKGNVKMLKGLLPYIDEINKLDANNQTAAHIAAKYGELECLKILFANGINLEIADKFGLQVSHIAAQQDHTDILEFLFEIGLSMNGICNKGKMPIHYAAEHGSFESIKVLEKYLNDISVADFDGNTPAHLAGINDHLKCVKFLFSIGLPVDKVRNAAGRNVAHVCCLSGSVRTLHWLLENGSDQFNIDNQGNTLAHTSCLGGQAECFNCCIQHDVPIDQLNSQGESPLDVARKVGKSFHIEKAARNVIRCSYCVKDLLRIKWEKENGKDKTSANKGFETTKSFRNSRMSVKSSKSPEKSSRLKSSFTEPDYELNRDFVAQYFGPEF